MDDLRKENRDQIRMAIRLCWSLIVLALSLAVLFLSVSAGIIVRIVRGQP